MGKQGPCFHCGITTTRLWRNGPPEKPVLCNACGSRWRTKGTLVDYTPLHARGPLLDSDKSKKLNTTASDKKKTLVNYRRKRSRICKADRNADWNFNFGSNGDPVVNASSSGSVVSNSEGCGYQHLESSNVSDEMPTPEVALSGTTRQLGSDRKLTVPEELAQTLRSIMDNPSFTFQQEDDLLYKYDIPDETKEVAEICNGCSLLVLAADKSNKCSVNVENKTNSDPHETAKEEVMGKNNLSRIQVLGIDNTNNSRNNNNQKIN